MPKRAAPKAQGFKPLKCVVVISDLHCGSALGLMPPGFVGSDDRVHSHTPAQRIVWKVWREFVDRFLPAVLEDDPFGLVVNGDTTEGVHHGGGELVTNDPGDHVRMAGECIAEIAGKAGCRKVFFTEGTECHTRMSEAHLARSLAAIPNADGRTSHKELMVLVNGCTVGFWHHMPTTSRAWLNASQLSIQWANQWISKTSRGFTGAQVVCAGHRHQYGEWTDGHGMMVVTPAWQARTRFGHKVVPGVVEGFGGVVLDWRKKDRGELPHVHKFIVPLAPPETIEI